MSRQKKWVDYRTSAGMHVLLEECHALPLVDIELVLRTGAVGNPAERSGLTRLSWRMMRMGTRRLRSDEVEDALASLGARLGVETSTSYVRVHGSVIRRNLDAFVELLTKLILSPAFRAADLARAKREVQANLIGRRDSNRALAGRAFRTHLFGEHPYARSVVGTGASIRRISRKDVRSNYERHFVARNLILGFAGAITPDEVRAIVDGPFSRVPRGRVPAQKVPAPRAARGRRVIIVDKPERTQTQIYIGTLGSRVRDPLYYPLMVANTAFGGTFTAPLMQEVREKRGWSYGAYSHMGAGRQRESWTMWTFPSAKDAAACINLELSMLDELVDGGVRARDHRFAKKYLVNSHCFDVDTASKRLDARIDAELFGLPASFYEAYPRHVRGVRREDSNAAVKKRISRKNVTIALVATAKQVESDLAALPGVTDIEVVPYDRV